MSTHTMGDHSDDFSDNRPCDCEERIAKLAQPKPTTNALVEMIEALQSEWFGVIEARKKNGQDGTIEAVIGMHARSLQPLLAAAREQSRDLTAMKEENSDLSLQVKHYHDARMPEQHDADLRQVAEMAIRDSDDCDELTEADVKGLVDSILAAFREKQHRETVCKVHGKHLCTECFPLEKAEVGK